MRKYLPLLLVCCLSCNLLNRVPSEDAFVRAIMKGDQGVIERYLAAQGDPGAKSSDGDPAILWAVYQNRLALTRTLLERGADPDIAGSYGKTALHWAAAGRDARLVAELLGADADPNVTDNQGRNPLHIAADADNATAIVLLLDAGTAPRRTNLEGYDPFMVALRLNNTDAIAAFLGGGFEPDQGHLAYAVRNNRVEPLLTNLARTAFPDLPQRIAALQKQRITNWSERPVIDVQAFLARLARDLNALRADQNLKPLKADSQLADLADQHARDMATRSYFRHNTPEGKTPLERVEAAGVNLGDAQASPLVGQNIYRVRLYAGTTEQREVQDGRSVRSLTYTWRDPSALRQAIVEDWRDQGADALFDARFHQQGLGMAFTADQYLYLTQVITGLDPVRDVIDTTDQTRPSFNAEDLGERIYTQLNQARTDEGLAEIPICQDLIDLATAHSQDMASEDYLDHDDSRGMDPTARAEAAGIQVAYQRDTYSLRRSVGEIVFRAKTYAATVTEVQGGRSTQRRQWHTPETLAQTIVDAILDDAGNRKTLFNHYYSCAGAGVAFDDADQAYLTLNFTLVELPENLATLPVTNIRDKPDINLKTLARRVHQRVNEQRAIHGLSALDEDWRLAQIARGHSHDMAKHNYFAHRNRRGELATDRAKRNGYVIRGSVGDLIREGIGENIFRGAVFDSLRIDYDGSRPSITYRWHTLEQIAQIAVDGWMNSPGHRANILNELYVREGIGIAIDREGAIYITQNFF